MYFEYSRRARRLNISVRIDRGVRVAIPIGVTLQIAEQFLMKHREFVIRSLANLQSHKPPILHPEDWQLKTREHQLVIETSKQPEIVIRIAGSRILVKYPETLSVTNQHVQSAIRKGLLEAYRVEAKKYLPERLAELAQRHHLVYRQVFIKNLKSRWGSCSAKNNINLNLQLMRLPDNLIDYVILHELIHTGIKNHSTDFWRALENLVPDFQQQRSQLRGYYIFR